MNRSITNVLFGGIAPIAQEEHKMEGVITKTSVDETVETLLNAESVIIVSLICPLFAVNMESDDRNQIVGYGMAMAKAQYPIAEIVKTLQAKGIKVNHPIFPVDIRRTMSNHIRI